MRHSSRRWLTASLLVLFAACHEKQGASEDLLVELVIPPSVIKVDTATALLIEYGAALCPACRQYAMQTSPNVTEGLELAGRLRTLYIEHSIDPLEGQIFDSVTCSGSPLMVAFRRFYETRPGENVRTRDAYVAHASAIFKRDTFGLRMCMDSSAVREQQTSLVEQGRRIGVTGTPTFFLGVLLPTGQFRGWPSIGLDRESWITSTLAKTEGTKQSRKLRKPSL